MEGLKCIDDFTIKCLDNEHRAYFNTLYAGTTQVIVDLCQEGPYQKGITSYHRLGIKKVKAFTFLVTDYLKHAPCMRQVQAGYEQCASSYQERIKTLSASAGPQEYSYEEYSEYEYEYEEDEDANKRRRRRQAFMARSPRSRRQANFGGEDNSVQLLCCSFQKYLHCSEGVVNTTCGHETALFTKSFLDRMSGPLIQVFTSFFSAVKPSS